MSTIAEDIQELVIEDVTFEEARMNFNRVLQRLFKNMIESDSTEGSITLKIDVSLENEYIPNYDPDNKNPEMQLIWDEERQMYVLAYITGTDQRTIFDKDQPWNQQEQEEEAIEADLGKTWMNTPLLTGEVADEGALPGEVADQGALPGEVVDQEEESGEVDDYGYEEPKDEDQEGEE